MADFVDRLRPKGVCSFRSTWLGLTPGSRSRALAISLASATAAAYACRSIQTDKSKDCVMRGRMRWALVFATITSVCAGPTALSVAEPNKPETTEGIDWNKEREFWSFRPPKAQARPAVRNKQWPSQPLDYFVLVRLEQSHLSPSPEADPRTLVRRVTFDLTGLPPTPEEIQAFLKDKRPDAYPRLAERLLASPRFGERLASLWLPLARYAEDQAHQVGRDTTMFYPHAYRYREWVIDAFNRDLPYDQFIRLQLAADKIDGDSENLVALGFLGLGPKYYNRNQIDVQADEWEDRVDTVSRA